ncbi:MAG: hypothetical protein QM809_01615 [Gordonia sp. (in: high G+C Gram-positive bacteria)]|uniref:hypothetical protein n=1 Tax=Gordonia sp. (in: high G+C Gram-positive bacteria) TaxID=84139 RepID=UPI0039E2C20E
MSRVESRGRRRPLGIAAVGLLGSLVLVLTAGAVLWGPAEPAYTASDGQLRVYTSTPQPAWTLSDENLPGISGSGQITVDDHQERDWLVAYPSAYGRAFLLIDAATGTFRWEEPVHVGLGDCAIDVDHRVGCAIKNGTVPDGFYMIDDEGAPKHAGPLDDSVSVTAVGRDFLRVNQFGRQASLRTPEGVVRWSRSFAGTASPRMSFGTLVVDTSDGRGFVLDPDTGSSIVECESCDVLVYAGGVLTQSGAGDAREITVYRRQGLEISSTPAGQAEGLTVVPGPSNLPILTGTGSGQIMETVGRYEVIDPATGHGLWKVADAQLSKSNTRPCGSVVALAKKDRSRVFYTLADGRALGSMAPPSYLDPDQNLDLLECVGTSGDGRSRTTSLFASRDRLTAFDAETGKPAWTMDINGTAAAVNGYVVLTQGRSITMLAPS